MTPDLNCYGSGIRDLADLVGDFDLRSPMDVHAWYRLEWQAIAEVLGFSQDLQGAFVILTLGVLLLRAPRFLRRLDGALARSLSKEADHG